MRLFNHFFIALLAISMFWNTNMFAEPLGTTGKIVGVVTDSKDNSPLPGAIISVEGTQLRAGSDDNGQFAILNVPVGSYSVKCTYVGYEDFVQTNVKVSADVTTTVDFSMVVGGLITEEIVVEAKIKTVKESGKIIGTEFIENTGIRGIQDIASKTAGVVQDEKGQNINIRGGRNGETLVIIDGVETNNPLDRASTANVSNNALQELAVLTGGFSAEYGNVLSGVINVTTKSATNNYNASVELVSDFIAGDWINTTSQGYNIYNASLGGPVIPTKKLNKFWSVFGSYERTFKLVDQPVSQDVAKLWAPDDGILPNFSRDIHSYSGKTQFTFGEITKGKLNLNLIAGYIGSIMNSRTWIGSYGYYNSYHNPRTKDRNDQYYAKISHSISSKTFYDLQGSFFKNETTSGDGVFFHDLVFAGKDGFLYPSLLAIGDTNVVEGITQGNVKSSSVNFRVFRAPGAQYNGTAFTYKDKVEAFSGNLNFTHQLLTKKYGNHEFKFGGNFSQYKIRHWEASPVGFSALANPNKYANGQGNMIVTPTINENGANTNFMIAYGYDQLGNLSDGEVFVDGLDITEGPKKPRIGAFYLLDKMEFPYFNTNLGVRLDYMDPNTTVPIDYRDMKGADGVFNDADYKQVEKTIVVSPRLGFSFPITDKTVFHAQYGKFIQLPALENLYTNRRVLRDLADGGVGYFTVFENPLLKPEKTTSYELGIKHSAGDYLTLGVTAYYKETSDLIQSVNIQAYDKSYNFAIYDNGDFGVIRGLDFSLDLRRFNRFRASVSYGLSFASGTGSDINSGYYIAYNSEDPPKIPAALDYDQRHTGVFELDYRWGGMNDVPKGFFGHILSRLGLNVLFTFNSGRPYTPSRNEEDPLQVASVTGGSTPVSTLNSEYSPWNYRLDLKLDKTVLLFNKLNINLYLLAINVLDQELVNDVFVTSGQPGYTGWLDSYGGKQWALNNGPEAVKLYNIRSHAVGNYGPPRQLRLGLRVFFN